MSSVNENQIYNEFTQLNSFELCHMSQEVIQDLINKTSDALQTIRALSIVMLYSDQNTYMQRRMKLEEIFNTFEIFVKRLRAAGQIVYQRKLALEQEPVKNEENTGESMVVEQTADETLATNVAQLESLKLERERLKEELKLKNGYLKHAIDKVNDVIWNINSMQTIKK
jgi:hypothetical protein